jgi:hypothetical protein
MSVSLWFHPAMLYEYAHSAVVRVRRHARGHTRHRGSAEAIIRAGIDRCWNGRNLTASPGHFNTFWTRDVCFSSTSLVRLEPRDRERLSASLAWAMGIWDRRGMHVTTTIHSKGHPSDVYDYGIDSLPLLVAGLRSSGADDLVHRHHTWLSNEIRHFADHAVDGATGLVRTDRTFSAHRDTVTNRSNAYGNTMVALLAKTLAEKTEWDLPNPLDVHFPDGDYGRLLLEHFWDGDHFRDAIGGDEVSGEANLWPFWTGVIDDRALMATAFAYLEAEGYCSPYPMRYETSRRPEIEVWLTRHLLPDYQGRTIWTSLGAIYLSLLRLVDPVRAHAEIERYRAWIEREGTFWEVLNADGTCWVSPRWLYIGEEAMLWSSIYLALVNDLAAAPALLSPAAFAVADEAAA